jgi:hypothetical protein
MHAMYEEYKTMLNNYASQCQISAGTTPDASPENKERYREKAQYCKDLYETMRNKAMIISKEGNIKPSPREYHRYESSYAYWVKMFNTLQ